MRTVVKEERLTVYAAMSPAGDVVKSSVSVFRAAAARFARERRGLVVVKLADINARVKKAAVPYKKAERVVEPETTNEVDEHESHTEAKANKRVRKLN